ncbi:MAG: hypothetical protein K0Q73_9040 [Paenibacillus sp.]|jgi:hypothetical protein|nr:hypothetical protein [Paenibacillus sp.]
MLESYTVLKGVQSAKRNSDNYGIYSQLEYVIDDLSAAAGQTVTIQF